MKRPTEFYFWHDELPAAIRVRGHRVTSRREDGVMVYRVWWKDHWYSSHRVIAIFRGDYWDLDKHHPAQTPSQRVQA